MRVELVQATQNPTKLIADIASISYGREQAKDAEKLVGHLLKLNHMSCFEHVYYTWKIQGISLTCLGQLTRHRMASFNVQSMRYTNVSSGDVIVPKEILKDQEAWELFNKSIEESKEIYKKLLEAGIKREDARFVLPTSSETNLYMSCNLRELIHIAELRISKQAQWEIRDLVQEMVSLVIKVSPELEFIFKEDNNETR